MSRTSNQKLIHIHSNVYTSGAPKSPAAADLNLGEIAVNYNDTEPCLFIKKNGGTIEEFIGKTQIYSKLDEKENLSNKSTTLSSASTDTQYPSSKAVYDVITSNEKVVASAINELNLGKSSTAHTHNYAASSSAGGTALTAESMTYATSTVNKDRSVWFSKSDNDSKLTLNASFTYNPNLQKLKVTNISASTIIASSKVESADLTVSNAGSFASLSAGSVSATTLSGSSMSATTLSGGTIYEGGVSLSEKYASSVLPTASTTSYGIVKIGDFISVSDGVISVATGTSSTTIARGDHNHDGRYYTETEIDGFLSTKADVNGSYSALTAGSATAATASTTTTQFASNRTVTITGAVSGSATSNFANGITIDVAKNHTHSLSEITDTAHTHSQYALEDSVATRLATKSDTGHSHTVATLPVSTALTSASTDSQIPTSKVVYDVITDNEEVTAAALNALQTGKSDTGHTHDDRYYTETEIDAKIATINTNLDKKLNISDLLSTSITSNGTTLTLQGWIDRISTITLNQ